MATSWLVVAPELLGVAESTGLGEAADSGASPARVLAIECGTSDVVELLAETAL